MIKFFMIPLRWVTFFKCAFSFGKIILFVDDNGFASFFLKTFMKILLFVFTSMIYM